MADNLGIYRDELKEIRRAINLKHQDKLLFVGEALKTNGSKFKLLRSVREHYRLPDADNL